MPDTLKGAHETHLSARRLHWAWMGGRTFLAHRAPVNVLRAITHLDCARTSRKGSAGDVARTTISSPTSLFADSFGEASKGGGIFSGQSTAFHIAPAALFHMWVRRALARQHLSAKDASPF